MPLDKSGGKEAFKSNVRTLMGEVGNSPHVQSRKQALAIAYATQRRSKEGGAIASALSTARRYGKAAGGEANRSATFNERYPSAVMQPLGGANIGPRMDSAWSNPDNELPMANALRKKAKELNKASGGNIMNMENLVLRGSAYKLAHQGMLNSTIPGRTDKLPMNVRAGSYILPADIPSALGQGNTMAGGEILKKMFNSGPYGMAPMRGTGRPAIPRLNLTPKSPKMPKLPYKKGGKTETDDDQLVPIVAAGGEWIVPPEIVLREGHGNMKHGHDVFDKFTIKVRKEYAKTLQKLPGPKR